MLIIIIGAIGMFATMYKCRQPGVEFPTSVTFANRKEKLTPNGANIYLLFWAVIAIGAALKIAGKLAS